MNDSVRCARTCTYKYIHRCGYLGKGKKGRKDDGKSAPLSLSDRAAPRGVVSLSVSPSAMEVARPPQCRVVVRYLSAEELFYLALILFSRSWMMVSLMPLPLGSEYSGLSLPMMKMLARRVAKELPVASLTVTMSKEPGWRSICATVPLRPVLRPLVMVQRCPISNLTKPTILPKESSFLREILTVSLTWMRGSGYRTVRPSWVVRTGIFLPVV
mmetsp:Transcript_37514/g.120375  ORF Transcript_37514/g.120375 Transcript_37514/m.120375 type:complete len:214 (+) Transcript_37514:1625-2266(+)